ncbi:MAG: hypothetical protein WD073_02495 [Xanthobacteraceae bacterium]
MHAGPLVGVSLLVSVAFEASQPPPGETVARLQMSARQKEAVIQPLMHFAIDYIARAVAAHPEFDAALPAEDINVLIAVTMGSCIAPMRVMIDAHNRLYGEGTGEAFFRGPYLDGLPAAVARQIKGNFR